MTKLRKIRFRAKKIYGDHWGIAFPKSAYIEIEERLEPYAKLNILCHELYHVFEPGRSEETVHHFGNEVERIARKLKLFQQEDD